MRIIIGKNNYYIDGSTTRIELSGGHIGILNTSDIDEVKDIKWYPHLDRKSKRYYIRSSKEAYVGRIFMHRLLLKANKNDLVDHRDFNGLNNCRDNIRLCKHDENMKHRKPQKGRRYKGVYPCKSSQINPYKALIQINGRVVHLGVFPTEIEGAKAYNRTASLIHGEFALLNKIPGE